MKARQKTVDGASDPVGAARSRAEIWASKIQDAIESLPLGQVRELAIWLANSPDQSMHYFRESLLAASIERQQRVFARQNELAAARSRATGGMDAPTAVNGPDQSPMTESFS